MVGDRLRLHQNIILREGTQSDEPHKATSQSIFKGITKSTDRLKQVLEVFTCDDHSSFTIDGQAVEL